MNIINNDNDNDNDLYKNYILSILKSICIDGKYDRFSFTNTHDATVISLHINYEHVLVRFGGRDCENVPTTNVSVVNHPDEYYACRIVDIDKMIHSDIIFDYSLSNIKSVEQSPNLDNKYNKYTRKVVYMSPCIFHNHIPPIIRTIDTLTSFIDTSQPRRHALLDKMSVHFPHHVNISDCFEYEPLQKMYLQSKILINIHQTDHHHTLEELRILPALQCGVIVISEESGLSDVVPYQHMIIWSTYDDMLKTTRNVLDHYEEYYNKIFSDENKDCLRQMHFDNGYRLQKRLCAMNSSLDQLSRYYALDKNVATNCHNYIPGYTSLFENIRFKVSTVLEIGIGVVEYQQMSGVWHLGYKTGNSLRCWRDYFIYADIYGVDIYPCVMNDEERIQTFIGDQSNKDDLQNIIDQIGMCDIIIDDGSHQVQHQIFTCMFLLQYIKQKGGIYVIEDVQERHDEFKNLTIFPAEFRAYIHQHFHVQCFDTRHERNRYDDFLIAFIRK